MSEPISGEVISHEHNESGPGAVISTVALLAIAGVLVYLVYRLFRLDQRNGDLERAYQTGVGVGRAEMEVRNDLRASERTDADSSDADTSTVAAKPRARSRKASTVHADNSNTE